MAEQLRPTVHQLIVKQAQAAGIVDPVIEVTEAAKNAESYSGNVYRAIVGDANNKPGVDRDSPVLQFIVKLPPLQEHRRLAFNSAKHFAREHFVLSQLMPAYAEFQTKVAPTTEAFNCFPKMLHSSVLANDEYVILEDLRAFGYATAERSDPLGFEHVAVVLRRLAQFHAVSFALKRQQPKLFAKLSAPLTEITFTRPFSQEMVDVMQPNVEFVLNAIQGDEQIGDAAKADLLQKLDEMRSDFVGMMVRCSEAAQIAPEEAVILHGDCWISNLMFGRADKDAPIDVQFLDWQVARYGSVAIDLSYFLFGCTDKKLRERLPELLQMYHTVLMQRIKELGSDGEAIFPFERFQWHMQQYARFGLGMAVMTLHATSCPAEDMENVSDYLDRGDDLKLVGAKLAEKPVYKRRVVDVFYDANELNYLM